MNELSMLSMNALHSLRNDYYISNVQVLDPRTKLSTAVSLKLYKRYTVSQVRGYGAYGLVCSAIDSKTQTSVAIKRCSLSDDPRTLTLLLREIKILKFMQGKHENIIHLRNLIKPESFEDFLKRREVSIVMELKDMSLGDKISSVFFSPLQIQVLMYQLLSAVRFLHSVNVVHRDIVRF